MSIDVQQVTRFYGRQKALDEVTLQVGRGEVVALLGPNGAGKSTLMKIITCFIPPNAGRISVCGFDVMSHPVEVKKRLGYLPEHNPLYHDMYVREYLHFVAGLFKMGRKKGRERVWEMIEKTGLQGEYTKKIGALSKGYRQRVGLAQALIHDPEVLILDEPASGLDPNQLTEIRQLIREIGREKTVLLSTHIMQEVEAICDRVVIIHQGQIVADAPTQDVKRMTQGSQVVRVHFNKAVTKQAIDTIPGLADSLAEDAHTFKIFGEHHGDIRPAIFHFAVENGLVILGMEQESQSLEQVFRQLTN